MKKAILGIPLILSIIIWVISGYASPSREYYTDTHAFGAELLPGTIRFGGYRHFQSGPCVSTYSRFGNSGDLAANPFAPVPHKHQRLLDTLRGRLGFESTPDTDYFIQAPLWMITTSALLLTAGLISISKRSCQED